VRGRLGLVSGPWLGYVTGGLAIGKLNTNGVFAAAASGAGPNGAGAWDESTTKIGWTIGVGVENAVSSNWSWKVEYLYVNLGNVTGSATLPATNCYGPPGICANASGPGTVTVTSKFTDNIVRVGLKYKFNN
jgi:outer membrane immunogenic protein